MTSRNPLSFDPVCADNKQKHHPVDLQQGGVFFCEQGSVLSLMWSGFKPIPALLRMIQKGLPRPGGGQRDASGLAYQFFSGALKATPR